MNSIFQLFSQNTPGPLPLSVWLPWHCPAGSRGDSTALGVPRALAHAVVSFGLCALPGWGGAALQGHCHLVISPLTAPSAVTEPAVPAPVAKAQAQLLVRLFCSDPFLTVSSDTSWNNFRTHFHNTNLQYLDKCSFLFYCSNSCSGRVISVVHWHLFLCEHIPFCLWGQVLP